MLTSKEIQIILDAIREKHGPGYAKDPEVNKLQVKLSILMEIMSKKEEVNATTARRD